MPLPQADHDKMFNDLELKSRTMAEQALPSHRHVDLEHQAKQIREATKQAEKAIEDFFGTTATSAELITIVNISADIAAKAWVMAATAGERLKDKLTGNP